MKRMREWEKRTRMITQRGRVPNRDGLRELGKHTSDCASYIPG